MALFAILDPEQQPNAPEVPVAISAKSLNLDCLRLGGLRQVSMVMQFIAAAYVKHR
jgi:hypothetical protein